MSVVMNKVFFSSYSMMFSVLCCGMFFWGCEETTQHAAHKPKQMSSKQLLQSTSGVPVHTNAKGSIRLPEVTQLQILWRDRKEREHLFDLYRDGRSWWAVELRGKGESWGYPLKRFSMGRMLKALRRLKPVDRSEFAPGKARIQLSLFAANKRFLMRMIQAPYDRGPTAVYKGEWLVYHHGSLYEQPARGLLGRSVPRLVRRLKRLSRRRGGMLLPLHSAGMDFRHARLLAQQLHKQRMSLKRCFKKRRFPSSIGPLKMRLSFLPTGKVRKLRILTRPHTKHKVVWCVWWFAKKFKLAPFAQPSIEYNLVIPPYGP